MKRNYSKKIVILFIMLGIFFFTAIPTIGYCYCYWTDQLNVTVEGKAVVEIPLMTIDPAGTTEPDKIEETKTPETEKEEEVKTVTSNTPESDTKNLEQKESEENEENKIEKRSINELESLETELPCE